MADNLWTVATLLLGAFLALGGSIVASRLELHRQRRLDMYNMLPAMRDLAYPSGPDATIQRHQELDSTLIDFVRLARLAGHDEERHAKQLEEIYRRRVKRRFAELGEDARGNAVWKPTVASVNLDTRDSKEYLDSLQRLEDLLVGKLRGPLARRKARGKDVEEPRLKRIRRDGD